MGIQKVLVAGIPEIVSQLSKEFLILVCPASAIFGPVVSTFGNDWLENFAFSSFETGIFWLGDIDCIVDNFGNGLVSGIQSDRFQFIQSIYK